MANSIPTLLLTAMWTDAISGDPVTAQAVDSTHGYVEATSQFLDDLVGGSFLGDPEVLAHTITGAGLYAVADVLDNIMSAEFVAGVVVYADTGSAATSPILAFIDHASDGTALNKEGDGTGMNTSFPSDLIAQI